MNYYVVAAALRALSAHSVLRNAYRWVGNRKRSFPVSMPKPRWIWEQVVKEGVDGRGHTLLELGTGWVHAGSLYSALLIDAEIIAFDVWDNRSLYCTKNEISRVATAIQAAEDHSESDKRRASERAAAAFRATTFTELYDALNITYIVDDSGIPRISPASVDMIYSQDVLEHVNRDCFASSIHAWKRILKPFGRFLALVGLDDHLAHYDSSKSMKEYLYHSDFLWQHLLSNRLQYINRLTVTEIIDLFKRNGFEIENFEVERCSVDLAAVHPCYNWQTQEDLEATCLRLYARAVP
jgi:SAM-dependent methyltransferase